MVRGSHSYKRVRWFLMKREPVRSSVIRSVGYDPKATTLEIEFTTKLVYDYFRVPRAKFNALISADSKGRFFNAHVRDHYDYEQQR
jgi:KTSC domain